MATGAVPEGGFSGLVTIVGEIPDDKYFRVTRKGQVGLHQNPSTAIELGAGGFGNDFTQKSPLQLRLPRLLCSRNGFEPVRPLHRHGARVDVRNRCLPSYLNS